MCDHDESDYEPDKFRERIDLACELGFIGSSADLDDWEMDQIVEND